MRKVICTAGAVCDLPMWRKPTSTRPGSTLTTDGAHGEWAGGELIGIGILGSAGSLSFREMESSIAHSAGDSTHPGGCGELHSMGTAMATGGVTAMASPAPIIASALTPATGGPARTTQQGAITPTASITDRDRRDVDSTLDLKWSGRRAASEDSVAVAFTEVVEEVTVGDRSQSKTCRMSCGQSRCWNGISLVD